MVELSSESNTEVDSDVDGDEYCHSDGVSGGSGDSNSSCRRRCRMLYGVE